MININNQESLFNVIGRALPKKVIVYAIGGTAMMLRGLKEETLDIDLVFDKEGDRIKFIETLQSLKFKKDEKRVIEKYGLKKNTPEMFRLQSDEFIFDLFLNKVVSSVFSDSMKERANQIHEFGTNLIIKAADPNDILIMKSATGRAKDEEDIMSIINKSKINWDIILEEAKEQFNLGNQGAIFYLGEKLEKLVVKGLIRVPKEVLDNIVKMHNKQIKSKVKK